MSEWFLKEAEKFLDEGADASQEFYGHPDGNL